MKKNEYNYSFAQKEKKRGKITAALYTLIKQLDPFSGIHDRKIMRKQEG